MDCRLNIATTDFLITTKLLQMFFNTGRSCCHRQSSLTEDDKHIKQPESIVVVQMQYTFKAIKF